MNQEDNFIYEWLLYLNRNNWRRRPVSNRVRKQRAKAALHYAAHTPFVAEDIKKAFTTLTNLMPQ